VSTDVATIARSDVQRGRVELSGVSKSFGETLAVDDVSLVVEPGEFLSLLGPSGCGKTTTLRMLAGFEQPDAGDILISGTTVVGAPAYRRDVNTVFQAYALFPHLTVAENVAYGLQQRRTPRAEVRDRVAAALDMVQMRPLADRKPAKLSGGQQQRVALARALINRPAVLLLDEPLAALDRKLREEMQLELKLLQNRIGTTFVFVTHDQGEALSMSDRIAVMRSGRIEQLAAPAEVYGSPASAYVAAFIGQQNFLPGTVRPDGAVEVAGTVVAGRWPDEPLPAGAQAQAAVRPEYVTVSPDGDGAVAPNSLGGTVIGVSHLGETMQYLVEYAPDLSLLVRTPVPVAPRLAVGERVRCSWAAEHVQVFPADGAAAAAGHVRPPTTAETV